MTHIPAYYTVCEVWYPFVREKPKVPFFEGRIKKCAPMPTYYPDHYDHCCIAHHHVYVDCLISRGSHVNIGTITITGRQREITHIPHEYKEVTCEIGKYYFTDCSRNITIKQAQKDLKHYFSSRIVWSAPIASS